MAFEQEHASRGMVERMIGAARLDPEVYEEVEADRSATRQAATVVVIVAAAGGLGAIAFGGIGGFIFGIVSGLVQWAVWAGITYWVGTTLFRTPATRADWGELARTTGFAQSPGVLRVFGVIPVIGPVIFAVVGFWQLAAMVIAVRQALDYESTWRAVGVVLVGYIPLVIILSLATALFA